MKKIVIILFILCSVVLYSKPKDCGTILDLDTYLIKIKEYSDLRSSLDRDELPDIVWAPITFHIVRGDNGTGGLPPDRIDIGLLDMINVYSEANILP